MFMIKNIYIIETSLKALIFLISQVLLLMKQISNVMWKEVSQTWSSIQNRHGVAIS